MSDVSKIYTVTPYVTHKVSRIWLWWLLILITGGTGFYFGAEFSSEIDQLKLKQINTLEERLALEEEAKRKIQNELASYLRGRQVAEVSEKITKDDVKRLELENQNLQSEIEFLKTLVSGDVKKLSINSENFGIDDSGRVDFSFVIKKLADNNIRVEGVVTIELLADQGEKNDQKLYAVELGLEKLKMGFRQFQRFEGSFDLPENTLVKEFVIRVDPRGRTFGSFEHRVVAGVE